MARSQYEGAKEREEIPEMVVWGTGIALLREKTLLTMGFSGHGVWSANHAFSEPVDVAQTSDPCAVTTAHNSASIQAQYAAFLQSG